MKLTEITVSRMIPAPPQDVFEVWMDPESPGGPWFGAERTILNPFVEGLFYQSVLHAGRSWHHYGRFIRIDRPHAVQHTWVSEATQGLESIVLVTFGLKEWHFYPREDARWHESASPKETTQMSREVKYIGMDDGTING